MDFHGLKLWLCRQRSWQQGVFRRRVDLRHRC